MMFARRLRAMREYHVNCPHAVRPACSSIFWELQLLEPVHSGRPVPVSEPVTCLRRYLDDSPYGGALPAPAQLPAKPHGPGLVLVNCLQQSTW